MPTWQMRLLTRAALTIGGPSSILRVSGFSTYTSLPALSASMAMAACQWSGTPIKTASTSFISSSLRWSLKLLALGATDSAIGGIRTSAARNATPASEITLESMRRNYGSRIEAEARRYAEAGRHHDRRWEGAGAVLHCAYSCGTRSDHPLGLRLEIAVRHCSGKLERCSTEDGAAVSGARGGPGDRLPWLARDPVAQPTGEYDLAAQFCRCASRAAATVWPGGVPGVPGGELRCPRTGSTLGVHGPEGGRAVSQRLASG